ncbi:hypothetical protein EHQ71_18310 [Leptospira levettii]|uniref:hypothetical protein n=1 Tax=Leptospira levettii TaxID=2023178 RepID=UPI001102D5CF|nr:hypothetical protein [Leptospira levettii]TGM26148.1 hypothetical protein EHQ71_18310 [Leptospira levettii]
MKEYTIYLNCILRDIKDFRSDIRKNHSEKCITVVGVNFKSISLRNSQRKLLKHFYEKVEYGIRGEYKQDEFYNPFFLEKKDSHFDNLNMGDIRYLLKDIKNIKMLQFRGLDMEELPSLSGCFSDVTYLYIRDCSLRKLIDTPGEFEGNKIRNIYIQNTLLKEFPDDFSLFPELRSFEYENHCFKSYSEFITEHTFRFSTTHRGIGNSLSSKIDANATEKRMFHHYKKLLSPAFRLDLRNYRREFINSQFRYFPKNMIFGSKLKSFTVVTPELRNLPKSLFERNSIVRMKIKAAGNFQLPELDMPNHNLRYFDLRRINRKGMVKFENFIDQFKSLRFLSLDTLGSEDKNIIYADRNKLKLFSSSGKLVYLHHLQNKRHKKRIKAFLSLHQII